MNLILIHDVSFEVVALQMDFERFFFEWEIFLTRDSRSEDELHFCPTFTYPAI
jgi:hypothetical protein